MKHIEYARIIQAEENQLRSYAAKPKEDKAASGDQEAIEEALGALIAIDLLADDAGLDITSASAKEMAPLLADLEDMSAMEEVFGPGSDLDEDDPDLSFGSLQKAEESKSAAKPPKAKAKPKNDDDDGEDDEDERSFASKSIKGQGGYALLPSKENPRTKRWQKTVKDLENPDTGAFGAAAADAAAKAGETRPARQWLRGEAAKKRGKDIGGMIGGWEKNQWLGLAAGSAVSVGLAAIMAGKFVLKDPALRNALTVATPALTAAAKWAPAVGVSIAALSEVAKHISRYKNRADLPTNRVFWEKNLGEQGKAIAIAHKLPPRVVFNAMANIGGVAYKRALKAQGRGVPKKERIAKAKTIAQNWVLRKMDAHLGARAGANAGSGGE